MIKNIFLSPKAEKDLQSIYNYINKTFGPASAKKFENTVVDFLVLLQNYPDIGTVEVDAKDIRCFVAHYRLKIFYRIKNNKIIVLRLFDTRQHPGKR